MSPLKAVIKLLLKKKKSFLEKQLWQEIENKSGCVYPLSGHVIVRGESVERVETSPGLYVNRKIGETNFHLLPVRPTNTTVDSGLAKSATAEQNHFI